MANIRTYSGKKFIGSEYITIFPCAYRGRFRTEINNIPKEIAFQPTARSFTEENLTSNHAKLGPVTSYLLRHSTDTAGTTTVEFILSGYYVVVQLTNDDLLTMAGTTNVRKAFCLRLTDQALDEFYSSTGKNLGHSTTIIKPAVGNDPLGVLDVKLASSNQYVFLGIEIVDENDISVTGEKLPVVGKVDGQFRWAYESKTILHSLIPSTGTSSLASRGNGKSGDDAVADSIADGEHSIALGEAVNAYGEASFATGYHNEVFGDNSSVGGANSTVTGFCSIANGHGITNNGDYASAFGKDTVVHNNYATTFGQNTETDTDHQVVIGKYNAFETTTTGTNVFTIGNGTAGDDNRHNLVNVKANGDISIEGSSNHITIGTENNTATVTLSDKTTINNEKITTLCDLNINTVKGNEETTVLDVNHNTKEMTLNGSFHETETFTLGSDKNAPEVKFDTLNKTVDISYNTINIGNTSEQYITADTANINTNIFTTVDNSACITGTLTVEQNIVVNGNNASICDTIAVHNDSSNNVKKVNIAIGSDSTEYNENRLLNVSGGANILGDVSIGALETTYNDTNKKNKLTYSNDYFVIDCTNEITTVQNTLSTDTLIATTKIGAASNNAEFLAITEDKFNYNDRLTEEEKPVGEAKIKTLTYTGDVVNLASAAVSTKSINTGAIGATSLSVTENTANNKIGVLEINYNADESPNYSIQSSNTKRFELYSAKISEKNTPYFAVTQGGITTSENAAKFNGVTITTAGITIDNVFSCTKDKDNIPNVIIGNTQSSIDSASYLTVYGTTKSRLYDTFSDERLKENIVSFTPKNSILDLDVKKFTYKADSNKTEHIGCLAQELQQICPELVHEGTDGYLTISESKLVYLLLDEVKKLRKEVDLLKEI